MNRRAFLSGLIAGLSLDPGRLLWRPGAKLISIPTPSDSAAIRAYIEECHRQALITLSHWIDQNILSESCIPIDGLAKQLELDGYYRINGDVGHAPLSSYAHA